MEPIRPPVGTVGRFSTLKDPVAQQWDRNKARIASLHQLPFRDYQKTATQFGVPTALADLTTTERELPKMECTTTTKSDYCTPSLDRYMKLANVCPEQEYPTSIGLEYCEGREVPKKPEKIDRGMPDMPPTPNTCVLPPKKDAHVKFALPPQSVPKSFYTTSYEADFVPPIRSVQPKVDDSPARKDYTPNVDYCSPQPDFKWPIPPRRTAALSIPSGKQVSSAEIPKPGTFEAEGKVQADEKHPSIDLGSRERYKPNYQVESEEHIREREIFDSNMERARVEHTENLGFPGSTRPLVKASLNPPNAEANYNVPNYTEGAPAGGLVRPRYGAPSRSLHLPIIDPSYPRAEYRIPPPEAGLTKSQYTTDMLAESPGPAGVKWTPPVRFPDKIYSTQGAAGAHGAEVNEDLTCQRGASSTPTPTPQPVLEQPIVAKSDPSVASEKPSEPQDQIRAVSKLDDRNAKVVDTAAIRGLKRIRTTNQMYGSWIDDPYLKDNDWWFKAKLVAPLQKTSL